ncbi:MAG: hypothetical protein AAGA50_25120, partial [Pseudomonadota bacterium]
PSGSGLQPPWVDLTLKPAAVTKVTQVQDYFPSLTFEFSGISRCQAKSVCVLHIYELLNTCEHLSSAFVFYYVGG